MPALVVGVHLKRTNPRSPALAVMIRTTNLLAMWVIAVVLPTGDSDSGRTRCRGGSLPKIISHDQAEYEPGRAERTFQRAANF